VLNFEFRSSNEEWRRAADFFILHSKFEILNSSAPSPHPPFGHLLPASGKKDLVAREAPGEGL
jgi:hypothetical protein